MPARFVSAANITSAYLSANTPLGLFEAMQSNGQMLRFLVVDHKGQRCALRLDGTGAGQLWLLNNSPTAWRGVALGEVELEIDLDSIRDGYPSVMDAVLNPAGPAVHAISNHMGVDVTLQMNRETEETDPFYVASNWRFVQRDAAGEVSVVYQRSVE